MATFPLIPLVQLRLNGIWTDVASDVYQRDAIQIKRGRTNEGSTGGPSSCELTFDNREGAFSPRNPIGPYYGAIGRNTPLRVLTGALQTPYMELTGLQNSRARTYDPVDTAGDIDIRVEVEPYTWRPGGGTSGGYGLAQRWRDEETIARAWTFYIDATGFLWFRWSTNGTTIISQSSTVAVPSTSGRLSVRVTLDVDNGAGNNEVKFYTATSFTGTYTQLGGTRTASGVTSINTPISHVELGRGTSAVGETDLLLQGKIYQYSERHAIDGSVVTAADFTAQDSGVESFAGTNGTFELMGNAVIVRPGARFHGEVSVWPPEFGKTVSESSVPISAAGILRRLGQGEHEAQSALYRTNARDASVVAYWPCEDGRGSTSLASAIPGGLPMTFSGDVSLAAFGDFPSSKALPFASGVPWFGPVQSYAQPGLGGSTQMSMMRFVIRIIDSGLPTPATVIRMETTGGSAVVKWDVMVNTAGSVRLIGLGPDGNTVVDSGYQTYGINGRMFAGQIELSSEGTSMRWTLTMTEIGAQTAGTSYTNLVASTNPGKVLRIVVNPDQQMQESSIGHISVHNRIRAVDVSVIAAHNGERATVRLARLCAEEGIPFSLVGAREDGILLGAQYPDESLKLIREAETADLGILYEPRGYIGLAYRTRESLYSQTSAASLNVSALELAGVHPIEDDQTTANDVKVTRNGGSSARVEATSGALSVSDPPAGVGRYSSEQTLSLYQDTQAEDQASWRVHLGTVDEARYPSLPVNLASEALRSNASLSSAVETLDIGARVDVSNLPVHPTDTAQIVQGVQERIGQYDWTINMLGAPASAWDVGVFDGSSGTGEARYSTEGTTLTSAATATATSLAVTTPTGTSWGSTDLPYDLLVGGEQIRVTAVSGSGASQTLTVTRSINGIVKAHAAGVAVALYKPARFAL